MNYYYERNDGYIEPFNLNGDKVNLPVGKISWDICAPSGEVIAEATTEENANLITTLMNHGQKTEEYQHGWPESPLP